MDGPGNRSIPGALPGREEERQTEKRFLGPSPSPRRGAGEVPWKGRTSLSANCCRPLTALPLSASSVTPGQPHSENSRNKQLISFKRVPFG